MLACSPPGTSYLIPMFMFEFNTNEHINLLRYIRYHKQWFWSMHKRCLTDKMLFMSYCKEVIMYPGLKYAAKLRFEYLLGILPAPGLMIYDVVIAKESEYIKWDFNYFTISFFYDVYGFCLYLKSIKNLLKNEENKTMS